MKLDIKESFPELANPDEIVDLTPSKRELKIYSESDIMTKTMKKKKTYKQPQIPFDQAVKLLKSLKRYRVPFEKMMLIATISSEITECVNNYWKYFEEVITSSLLNIDADELMTIFIYIIIKTQMPEILIHSKFIKEFTTSTTRSTMVGYYYTTVEASMIYILTIKDKSELLNRDKIRQSLIPNKNSFIESDDFTMLAINQNTSPTRTLDNCL